MKLFLIIGGLVMIIFMCVIPLKQDLKEYKVQNEGELVSVTIVEVPNCIGTKNNAFMKFNYYGQEFSKKVGCAFSDKNKIGDQILLKHIEGSDTFLFEDEKKEAEFISISLMGVLGIVFIVIGLRKK